MHTFLQYVAKDIITKHGGGNLADIAVVFPNKRASLFLNQALFEEAGHAVWSPSYITISDLFRQHSDLKVPDQIELIFRLYREYVKLTGSDEPLDHFFSWGQLMLADFDDLDKNLVEADKLFINLEAWQEMRDYSFLSEEQRKSLEDFFGKVETDTVLQKKFNDIWKKPRTALPCFPRQACGKMDWPMKACSTVMSWSAKYRTFITSTTSSSVSIYCRR